MFYFLFHTFVLGKPVHSWGAALMDSVLPKAKIYIETIGVDVEENMAAW